MNWKKTGKILDPRRSQSLNKVLIPTDGESISQKDYSVKSDQVDVYFKDLDRALIELIRQADFVFGCVAWLTHEAVLTELAKKESAIVVQKEDFLRPDFGEDSWNLKLRMLYKGLRCSLQRYSLLGVANSLSVCASPEVDPIRCVGSHNADKKSAFPRAHHKFLVFARIEDRGQEMPVVHPYAVWTGSFNITQNATMSFENAVVIRDSTIVHAFAHEFGQVFALSEALNWEQPWVEPEYRIGT